MDAHLRAMGHYRDGLDPVGAMLRSPMLRVAIPFVVGLLLARVFTIGPIMGWSMVAVGVLAQINGMRPGTPFRLRWISGVVLVFTWFWTGVLWQGLHSTSMDHHGEAHQTADHGPWLVQMRTVSITAGGAIRSEVDVLSVGHPEGIQAVNWRWSALLLPDAVRDAPVVGDRMWIIAEPKRMARVPDPGGFDRQAWAASKGITHEVVVRPEDRIMVGRSVRWTDLFLPARDRVSQWLVESGLPQRERAIVKALILGARDELDDSQRTAFARSGTMHVLAVSGMHVGLIYGIFTYLLGWMGERNWARIVRGLFLILLLWCYAGLTGASPSVLRASIMFTFFAAAGMLGRRSASLNGLFGAALILLLWDPLMIGQLSFQFSFLAVFGIVLFYDPLRRLWAPPNRVLAAGWSLAAVSVAAQLTTTPLAIFTFKAFPVWFLPANLVVVFQISGAVCSGGILLLLHKLPIVGEWISWLVAWQLRVLGGSTDLFATLPGAYPDIRIDTYGLLIGYGLVVAGGLWAVLGMRHARTAFLVLCIAVLWNWGRTAHERNRATSFTVYDMRGGILASMGQGRTLDVLMDEDAERSGHGTRKVAQHLRGNGASLGIQAGLEALNGQVPHELGASLIGGGLWVGENVRVAFMDGTEHAHVKAAGGLDAIVLLPDARLAREDVGLLGSSGTWIVLHPDLPAYHRSALRNYCADAGIPCHDVRMEGAFVLER